MDTRLDEPGTAAAEHPPIELQLTGMTCSACAVRIQKKLGKLDGVAATVNFATERAVLRGLPAERTAEAVAAVEAAGYGATAVVRSASSMPETSAPERSAMLLRRLIVAAVLTLPLGNLAIVLALVPELRFPFWDWLCVLIATPVVFWCAWPFHRAAAKNLRHGSFSMDTLVSLGVLASYFWSVFAIIFSDKTTPGYWVGFGQTPPGADSIYLEVAAGVTTFLLAGRYFEAKSRHKASGVLGALAKLAVGEVRVLRDGQESLIPISQLRVGEQFVVRPGERVACDGEVLSGQAGVDTSPMTGEPEPKPVAPGDGLIGGTVVLDGRLLVRALKVGESTQLAQLAALAEHAQTRKANIQALVERIVGVFVPVILVLTVLVFAAWMLSGNSAEKAFGAAISVLIIACPCALGLATPMALMVGVGRGSQLGILIKSQQALESSGRIDTVVLDKTGTLTTGEMSVHRMAVFDVAAGADPAGPQTPEQLTALAAAAEAGSEHPTARAIIGFAEQNGLRAPLAEEFGALPGRGVRAVVQGAEVLVGSAALLAERGVPRPPSALDDATGTLIFLAVDGVARAVYALQDSLRKGAGEAVGMLHGLGLHTVLLSGDRQRAADDVAAQLGMKQAIGGVLPTEKAKVLADLQAAGRRIAMVGDGINDAAALATANLGMAMVSGTDVAMKSADIILIRPDLRVVADAIVLSRRTLRTIRGNLVWAFVYNVAAIPLAAFGLLNPLIAGAAMSLSSLFVVTNSLRLRNFTASSDSPAAVGDPASADAVESR